MTIPDAPPPTRALGPAGAAALAVAAWVGAVMAQPLSLLVPLVVVVAAFIVRRPLVLVLAAGLAGSALGQRAEAGLEPPVAQRIEGAQVELASDPETRFGRVQAIARVDGRLVLVEADGPASELVGVRLAGERVIVTGRLGPPPADTPWLRVRHVSGRLTVKEASPGPDSAPPWRLANRVRRVLVSGAEPLGAERRSLYVGLVYGDDREQTPEAIDDFRGAGLSHLLAVSGQNVALVLAVALPLLRRLPRAGRLMAIGAILVLFVLVTRAEPSVLRAVAMAAGAAIAATAARPTPPVQILGLGVTACVLVDPLLVGSVGFHLSVAATSGILLIAPRLVAVLPGPLEIRLPVAVSVAAQMGVAPLLVVTFEGVPVASLVANLLAAPAAAAVMTWGLPAGLVAGLAGPPVDGVAHLPTGLALDWLMAVARRSASLPFGQLGLAHVVVLWSALAAVMWRRPDADSPAADADAGRWPSRVVEVYRSAPRTLSPRFSRWLTVAAASVALACLVQPGLVLRHPSVLTSPSPGVEIWRRGGATVVSVDPGTGPSRVLEGLRLAGVTHIDVLLLGGGAASGDEERAARHRAQVRSTWWRGRSPPVAFTLGGLDVRADHEAVEVGPTLEAAGSTSEAPSGGR